MKPNDQSPTPITWTTLIKGHEFFDMGQLEYDEMLNIQHHRRRAILRNTKLSSKIAPVQAALMFRMLMWLKSENIPMDYTHPDDPKWNMPIPKNVTFEQMYSRFLENTPLPELNPEGKMRPIARYNLVKLLSGSMRWLGGSGRDKDPGENTKLVMMLFYYLNTHGGQDSQKIAKAFMEFIRNVVEPELIARTGLTYMENLSLMHRSGRRAISWKKEIVEQAYHELGMEGRKIKARENMINVL